MFDNPGLILLVTVITGPKKFLAFSGGIVCPTLKQSLEKKLRQFSIQYHKTSLAHSKTSFSISLQHQKGCMAPMPSMYWLQTGQAYSEAMIHRGLHCGTCQLLYSLCLTPSSLFAANVRRNETLLRW
jgi:hypothetical protein